MLVLSRKTGDQVFIGSDIVLTVVEVRGDKVRIGIDAPKTVQILRDDIKKQEKGSEANDQACNTVNR